MQSETADVSTKKSIILKGEFAPPVSWTTRVEVPQQSEHTASGESMQAIKFLDLTLYYYRYF